MRDLSSFDSLYLILGFLVPGLVVLFVRSQFVTGRRPPHSASVLSYLTISVIYYALALPLLHLALSARGDWQAPVAWFSLILVGPAGLGLLLGLNVQKDWLRRLLQRWHLNVVHPIPTAWDWKFGRSGYEWVLVTLKDGTRFGGFCGPESFMSSDPKERDIYVQWVYEIDDKGQWSARDERGLLIAAGEVRTIEFWSDKPGEKP